MKKGNIAKVAVIASIVDGFSIAVSKLLKKMRNGIGMKEEMPDLPKADQIYRDKVKRYIDLAIAVPITIIAAIPMLIVAIAIKIDSQGPVIFKQERIGKNGKVFQIWKFRSMYQNAEHTGSGVYSGKDDSRVTRVGKFIRATSIDELPQLYNVLKGDRGIIGTTKKNIDFSSVVTA